MPATLSKDYYYGLIFLCCISVPYLVNFELTFFVWSLAAVLTLSTKYSITILKYIFCFLLILTVSFFVMFSYDYKFYYIFRDFTYMLKPILGLLIGYQIAKKIFKNGFQAIAYTGVFIATIHVGVIISDILFKHARSINAIRAGSGYFSDYEVYALIVLVFSKEFELGFSKSRLRFFTLLVGFSAFMYFARTNFIQFGILFLAMKGFLKINKTSITVLASVLAFAIIGYTIILYINPKRNGAGIEALLYKIKIAPTEPFKTRIDESDWRDFNDNYRSFENISTVKQISKKGPRAVIFGEGMGSKIDLKREVWLGDKYLQFISILHNGYMTVFLKSGLIGVLIYLFSIRLLFKQNKSTIPIVENINLLLVGTGVFLIFSNWVFMGLYNLLDNKSILIGFLICYAEMKRKQQINIVE